MKTRWFDPLFIVGILLISVGGLQASPRSSSSNAAVNGLTLGLPEAIQMTQLANAENVEFVGHIGGPNLYAFADGNYVYVGEGPRLTILDITNPALPIVLGKTLPLSGIVEDIYVSNDYAYIAADQFYARSGGLQVVDVSDPSNPIRISSVDTPGFAHGVHVSGSTAFVADTSGLRIVDISDPTCPTEISFIDDGPWEATDVYVSGGTAFVVDGGSGLWLVDVSDPANPTTISHYETPGTAEGVFISMQTAYVADGRDGLRVIDVSDPTQPTEIGYYDTAGIAYNVYVNNEIAYVADGNYGLRLINVSDPTNPYETGYYYTGGYARGGVHTSDNITYVSDFYSLRMVDVSDPTEPTGLGFYDPPGAAIDVYVSGSIAYVAGVDDGLHVIDVSDSSHPGAVGLYNMPGQSRGVYVKGSTAYVANYDYGLWVVDVSDPAHPTKIGSCDTQGLSRKVFVSEDIAYVADGYDGLRVVDVSDPANPTEIGFYDTLGKVEDLFVSNGIAYLAERVYNGLRMVDIGDPTNPTEIGYYPAPNETWGVYVDGNIAYLAVSSSLRMVDVSDPAHPFEVGFCSLPSGAYDSWVNRGIAYVADGLAGLRVVDVRDPTHPTEIGYYDTPGQARSVYVSGGIVYVADTQGGLSLLRYTGGGNAYLAAGQVQAVNRIPIPNVTLSTADGYNAITDANGYYTITSLFTGTYTFTPTKSGWTFTPVNRTVSVPPDATNQDFTGTSIEPLPQFGLMYGGPRYLSATAEDERITVGDHVHLQIPFWNLSDETITDAMIYITGEQVTDSSVGVLIHNGTYWGNYQVPIQLTPPDIEYSEQGIADFWIYVSSPDPDNLQSLPAGTWIEFRDGEKTWRMYIYLQDKHFDVDSNRDMLAGSCLHHPDDPQILRYAQYAAGAPEERTPPDDIGDPDTIEQALKNLVPVVRDQFYDSVSYIARRSPDIDLLAKRYDRIGSCRHYADLTAGLVRSLGIPTRYVRGQIPTEKYPEWPGRGHMWNEVDAGNGTWQMIDTTKKRVFDPSDVFWAWADRYPLSTASSLTLHWCNAFCINNRKCNLCQAGVGEVLGIYWGAGQGCMEDVTSNYGDNILHSSWNTPLQVDAEQAILLDVSAPVFVTRNTLFAVTATVTNNTYITMDTMTMTVSPYPEAGWETPIYVVDPPSHTLSSVLPGQAVTVTWSVTPLLAGKPLPLQVLATSGDAIGIYEQLQNVNEPGTLPDLLLTAGCDQKTVPVGTTLTLTALVADEHLQVITDSLSTITTTVYATPTASFSTTFNLAYCADCQYYTHELVLPYDAPTGRYQVEHTLTRPGYESEHTTTSFFVTPALTMTLAVDPPVLGLTDPMTLTAHVYDRGYTISQAGVYAEIVTPNGDLVIPLLSSGSEIYTTTLHPADLADNLGTPLLSGQWLISAYANYMGGRTTAAQPVTVRYHIFLPLVLRNS